MRHIICFAFPQGNHIIRNKMHFQTCKYMDVNLVNIPFDDEELKKDLSWWRIMFLSRVYDLHILFLMMLLLFCVMLLLFFVKWGNTKVYITLK